MRLLPLLLAPASLLLVACAADDPASSPSGAAGASQAAGDGGSSASGGSQAAAGQGGQGGQAAAVPCDDEAIKKCRVNQLGCQGGDTPTCVPCEQGSYAAPDGRCTPIAGKQMAHDFPTYTVAPGEEVVGRCQSWTLHNPEELWVNAVEMQQDVAYHHANWTFVPDTSFVGPDGAWDCKSRDYDQLGGALAGGVLYAMSTQATREVQKFPEGVAVRIPPYARIISDVHLINAADVARTGKLSLSLHTIEPDAVKVKLVPFHLDFLALKIPPHGVSRFEASCDIGKQYRALSKGPLDLKLYYLLPHTHGLGSRFFVDILGGPRAGERLLEVEGYDQGARGRAFEQPIDLTGADGFSFGCEFTNPRDAEVGYGVGDQEMCETLGFAESKVGFESTIKSLEEKGVDGETRLFGGPCETIAFKWDHDKPGGAGP